MWVEVKTHLLPLLFQKFTTHHHDDDDVVAENDFDSVRSCSITMPMCRRAQRFVVLGAARHGCGWNHNPNDDDDVAVGHHHHKNHPNNDDNHGTTFTTVPDTSGCSSPPTILL